MRTSRKKFKNNIGIPIRCTTGTFDYELVNRVGTYMLCIIIVINIVITYNIFIVITMYQRPCCDSCLIS